MSAAAAGAGIKHPLMGARLGTLLNGLINGGASPQNLAIASLMMGSALARLPIRPLEALVRKQRAARAPVPEAPVFVIGHWRSGTTHLHNLLGRSPYFGHISPIASGLPDEILTIGTWLEAPLARQLPEDRGVDRVAVRLDSPQEDEIPLASLLGLSIFQALYFPKEFQRHARRGIFFEDCTPAEIARWQRHVRAFAEKISLHQDRPRLLIKNPVHTARIALLREIWPDARFIHIRRNPYEVFASTRAYFNKLLPELALQPHDHVDVEGFVLETFLGMMRRYDEQSAALGEDELVEVSYEELIAAPLAILEHIHDRIALPGWAETHPRVEQYLASIHGYRTNGDRLSDRDAAKVEAAWGDYLERWQYRRPSDARP